MNKLLYGLLGICNIVIFGLGYKLNEISNQNIQLRSENTTVQANYDKLTDHIKVINSAITDLSQQTNVTVADFNKLQTNVSSQVQTIRQRLDQLNTIKKPETCEQTIKFLIDNK